MHPISELTRLHHALGDRGFLARFAAPALVEEGGLSPDDTRPRRVQVLDPDRARHTVGRREGADLWVNSPGISKLHAELVAEDGAWWVRDLGSTNGTFLDGRRVAGDERRRLAPGALLRFGSARPFTVHSPKQLLALVQRLGSSVQASTAVYSEAAVRAASAEDFHEATAGALGAERQSGRLEEQPLMDLLHEVEVGQQSGLLWVHGEELRGSISFRGGVPLDAACSSGETSAAAVRALCGVRRGRYTLLRHEHQGERRIMLGFSELLADLVREESRLSAERLRAIVECAPHGILTVDEAGAIESANPAARRLFGERAAPGRSAHDLLAAPAREQLLAALRAGPGATAVHELEGLRPDGAPFALELSVGRCPSAPGGAVLAIRDVSELREAQRSLIVAQKMEAIGRLAGGIAHDFNNLLSVVNGYAELLLDSGLDERRARQVRAIARAGSSAAALTRKLLTCCRRQPSSPRSLDLNAQVLGLADLLRSLLGDEVELALELEERLGQVHLDEGQLEQVLVNLTLNARDALPGPGRVTIATRAATLGAARAAQLEVRDTGLGMSPEVVARACEPFFTTKPVGKGTGLGLSVAYGIVTGAGGALHVSSQPGAGASVRLTLPAIGEPAADPAPAQAPLLARAPAQAPIPTSLPTRAPGAAGRPARILVVEDQPALQELLCSFLRELGHEVVTANDGRVGLALASSREFDLVITDVVMPRMGGVELIERLRALRPTQRYLYVSGYTDRPLVGDAPLLDKPFTLDQLALTVERALAQEG
ncbi:MAG: ATP-binding protein [Planctomycetota bacterium]